MPHFEIHTDNVERAKSFYAGLFGWSFDPMPGAEDMGYHLIEGPDIGMEKGVTGGIMRRMGDRAPDGAPIRGGTMTFEVTDCDDRYTWTLANGGAEALPSEDYPGIGRCAYVEDGEGNVAGMITTAQEEH